MGKHRAAEAETKRPPAILKYTKFLVALAGFLVTAGTLVATYLTTGAIDINGFVVAGTTFLAAIGVYQLPNKSAE